VHRASAGHGDGTHRIAALEALSPQSLVESHQRQALTPAFILVFLQQLIQARPVGGQLRQGLCRALVLKFGGILAEHLADGIARHASFPGYRLDGPAVYEMVPTDLCDCFHHQHPLLRFRVESMRLLHLGMGVNIARRSTPHRYTLAHLSAYQTYLDPNVSYKGYFPD
jgi:hypothetical protein